MSSNKRARLSSGSAAPQQGVEEEQLRHGHQLEHHHHHPLPIGGGDGSGSGAVHPVADVEGVLPERHCRSNDFMSIDNCGEVMTADNTIAPPAQPFARDPSSLANARDDLLVALRSSAANPEAALGSCLAVLRRAFSAKYGSDSAFHRELLRHAGPVPRSSAAARSPLPDDIVLLVMGFLSPRDLASAAQVCVAWANLARRSYPWRQICRQWNCLSPLDYSNRLFQLIGQKHFMPTLADVVPLVRAGADLAAGLGARRATPFLLACYHGHIEVAKWLLNNGSSLSERTRYGKSALLCAAWGGQVDIVAWLYENPVCHNDCDVNGHSALLCAAMGGSVPVCSWLLSHGAKLSERANDGKTPLLCAATSGHYECTRFLLQAGSSIQERSLMGMTAFLLAVSAGKMPLILALLNMGANVNERAFHNENALMMAAMRNHVDLIGILLDTGTLDVNAADIHGFTALHYARCNDNDRAADALIARGAQESIATLGGATASDARNLLHGIRERSTGKLEEIFARTSDIILKINPCAGHNLADADFLYLLSLLHANRTISTIVMVNTNIQPVRCEAQLLALLAENRLLTALYFGEREEQQLPRSVAEVLRLRNTTAGMQ
eukprot:m.2961 g.2961  ORF g.2961 m.2961 type:complete len:611 (-) comp2242_c0_seq1:12-1844(-)